MAATAAGVALLAVTARAQTIPNPSFEADTFFNAPGYCSVNGWAITGWTVSEPSRVGLNPAAGNPFANNGATPQGADVAFIQTTGTTNTLATTITGLTPGARYALTCRVNARVGLPPTVTYATPTMGLGINGGAPQPFVVPAVAAMGSHTTPYRLATATNVVAIAAGANHSLALKADGTVIAWGDNHYNQTNVPATATDVVAIAGGHYHSLALRADGMAVAWGWNNYGQTNVPTTATNVVAIAGGDYHSLALKVDGTVVAWGKNNSGQTTVPSFVQTLLATSGTVNTNVADTYTLTYSYTNGLGTVLTTNRMVVVMAAVTNPPILANLAVTGGNVGFTLSGDPGQTVVVETCTNLAAPVWLPVQTNTLGGSPANFSAPVQPGQPSRFYRLRSP